MNVNIIYSTKLSELISRALVPKYCIHFRDDDISLHNKIRMLDLVENYELAYFTIFTTSSPSTTHLAPKFNLR